jgi:uncharacterized membrane protein
MNWYPILTILHVLATALWFGHMFFWAIFAGPVMKKIEPAETAQQLRETSLSFGGLGWPSLVVLIVTGSVMLGYRGVTFSDAISGAFFAAPQGSLFGIKFSLVILMILYQTLFGHRSAPRAIYFNMLVALLVVALSVYLARG